MVTCFRICKEPVLSRRGSYMYEPRCEKTGLRGFRPGPTLTGLYSELHKMARGLTFRI